MQITVERITGHEQPIWQMSATSEEKQWGPVRVIESVLKERWAIFGPSGPGDRTFSSLGQKAQNNPRPIIEAALRHFVEKEFTAELENAA